MKKYLIILLLCISGLVLAYQLLPREQEVALMLMRDKQFQVALDTYENQKNSGDLSVNTVGTLAQLYLQHGYVEKAIELMEEFVKAHPENIEARLKLGHYYQYAQRTDDYLKNLEELVRIDPKQAYLEELTDIYNYTGDYNKQIEMLQKLVERDESASHELLQLVQLHASMGNKEQALAYMRSFEKRFPKEMNEDSMRLSFSLLMDTGRYQEAYENALTWSKENKALDSMPYFATQVATRLDVEKALGLLTPHKDKIDAYPEILISMVDLQRGLGRNEEVFQNLEALEKQNRLPSKLMPTLIELSLEFSKDQYFLELVNKANLKAFPDEALYSLAQLSGSDRFPELRGILLKKLDYSFVASRPVLDTALVLSGNDQQAKIKHVAQLNYRDMPATQRARIAMLLARYNFPTETLQVLNTLPSDDTAIDDYLPEIAISYLQIGYTAEGKAFFDKVQSNRKNANSELGWLVVTAGTGDEKAVTEWLDANGNALNNRRLLDLYYITDQAKQKKLALIFAERFFERQKSDLSRINLADAYIENGMPEKALPLLDQVEHKDTASLNDTRVAAMQQIVIRKRLKGAELEKIRAELSTILIARLNDPKLSANRREDAVYGLINIGKRDVVLPEVKKLAQQNPTKWGETYVDVALKSGQHKEALPYLRTLALSKGGNWIFAYEETLQKLGRGDEILPVLEKRAQVANLSADERRTISYKLADYGKKQEAARILTPVAMTARPDSKDVSQLLWLWDDKPPQNVVSWMDEKARRTNNREQAQWFGRLIQSGASSNVVSIVEQQYPQIKSSPLTTMLDNGEPRVTVEKPTPVELKELNSNDSGDESKAETNDKPEQEADAHISQLDSPFAIHIAKGMEKAKQYLNEVEVAVSLSDFAFGFVSKAEASEEAALEQKAKAANPEFIGPMPVNKPTIAKAKVKKPVPAEGETDETRALAEAPKVSKELSQGVHPDVRLAYIQATLQTHEFDKLAKAIEPALAYETDYNRLKFLGDAARDAGEYDLAIKTYNRLLENEKANAVLLRDIGHANYYAGRFSTAHFYYDRYLEAQNGAVYLKDQSTASAKELSALAPAGGNKSLKAEKELDYLVPLRLAIIEKRDGSFISSRQHFAQALDIINKLPKKSFEVKVAEARALANLGRTDEAATLYKELIAAKPNDPEVAADYVEMLMNNGNLKAARVALDESRSRLADIKGRKLDNNALSAAARLDLQHAELLLAEGKVAESLQQYEAVEKSFPNDVYAKIGQATIQDYMGKWQKAAKTLDKAISKDPENEDLKRARRDVVGPHGPSVTAGVEWRDVDNAESGYTYTVKGQALLDNYDQVKIQVDRREIEHDQVALKDGSVGRFDDGATQAEIAYLHGTEQGNVVRGSLLAGESGPGATIGYDLHSTVGTTSFTAEYHRPYWEIAEGVVQDAAKDMVEVGQTFRERNRFFGSLAASGNRYTIDGDEEVAQSVGFDATLGYRIRSAKQRPSVALIYALDAEYMLDDAETKNGVNGPFTPFPLDTREVHSLGLNVSDRITRDMLWEIYGGYAVDRLGGSGPFVTGDLDYFITDSLVAELRGASIYNNNGNGGRINTVGGYLTYRF